MAAVGSSHLCLMTVSLMLELLFSFSAVRFHGTDIACIQDIIHLQLHCTIVIDFDDSAWSFARCGTTLRSPFVLCEDILVCLMRTRFTFLFSFALFLFIAVCFRDCVHFQSATCGMFRIASRPKTDCIGVARVVVCVALRIPQAVAERMPGICSSHVSAFGMSNARITLPIVW